MAETINRGPNVSIGSLMDGRVEPFDGPGIEYQGVVTPDPRFSPAPKDGVAPARVVGYYNSGQFIIVDAVPSATSTTTIAVAVAPSTTTGVALLLNTAVLGTAANVQVFAPGIPIIPTNTTVPVLVSAIDFGFTTGTTASNSSTVVVTDNTVFTLGQWIVIGGAGSGSVTNKALITQVASVSANGTGVFISPAAATALNNAPIGQGNLYSQFLPPATQFGPSAASANAAEPYQAAGFSKMFDPRQGVTRTLQMAAASIGSGTTVLLASGFDIYGVPMSELFTLSGTTAQLGKKAFKYIAPGGITVASPATSGTPATVTVGVTDIMGFNIRNDKWEFLDIFYNGGFSINNTGWTSAVTSVATNTTGDVRGTQNMSTAQIGTTAATTINGARRVTIVNAPPQQSMISATPLNSASLFGVTQA
jgi:hypothetical protein